MYYFKLVENGLIPSVEAKSRDIASPGFVKTTKAKYDSFIASLPVIEDEPEPSRDLKAEIDELKKRIKKLEGGTNG